MQGALVTPQAVAGLSFHTVYEIDVQKRVHHEPQVQACS